MKRKTGRPSCTRNEEGLTVTLNSKPMPQRGAYCRRPKCGRRLRINQGPDFLNPNLDMMASQGYNFVNARRCRPVARAALLTGLIRLIDGGLRRPNALELHPDPAPKPSGMRATKPNVSVMHVYPAPASVRFDHVTSRTTAISMSIATMMGLIASFEQSSDYLLSWTASRPHDDGLNCNSDGAAPGLMRRPPSKLQTEAIEFSRFMIQPCSFVVL